jgi:hypothetical protein
MCSDIKNDKNVVDVVATAKSFADGRLPSIIARLSKQKLTLGLEQPKVELNSRRKEGWG